MLWVFLLCPSVLEGGPLDVFKGVDNIVGGEMPDITVFSLNGRSVIVDVTGKGRIITTNPDQNGPVSNNNEDILHVP